MTKDNFLKPESATVKKAHEYVALPPGVILGEMMNTLSRNGQSKVREFMHSNTLARRAYILWCVRQMIFFPLCRTSDVSSAL